MPNKVRALIVALVWLWARPCVGAVTIDATGGGATYPDSNPTVFTHVVGSGTNRLLRVGFAVTGNSVAPTISAATYGGTAMTLVVSNIDTTDTLYSYIYQLINPTVGSASVSITLASATGRSFGGYSVSFFGADQTTPGDVTGTTTGTLDTTQTESITTLVDASYIMDVDAAVFAGTAGTQSAGGSQTVTMNLQDAPGFAAVMGSYRTTTTAGAYTMTWSSTWTDYIFAGAWATIKPAGGAACAPTLSLLAVGRCG